MAALLLLSCSASKLAEPVEPIPAIARYTGVLFRVLKKWQREHPPALWPDVLIISAEFGLLTHKSRIPHYERVMTVARAAALSTQVQDDLEKYLLKGQYRRILVNLGRNYCRALDGFHGLSGAVWGSGPIGKRSQKLKAWLNEPLSENVNDLRDFSKL